MRRTTRLEGRMRLATIVLSAALASLPGCACDTVPAGALTDCQATQVLPDAVQTDILFVIDDSLSMAEEQANLRDNLGAFVDALVASSVQNDFRIGVTSSSVEAFGATATTGQAYASGPAQGVPYPDGALVAIRQDAGGQGVAGALRYDPVADAATGGWGGRRILERGSATLAQDFKANVLLGTSGSGKEQPFRAVRLALSDRLTDANAGFLRPGARLAVIFVTDEDDCSDTAAPFASSNDQCHARATKDAEPPILDPPEELAAFLLGPVDGERREVVVGAIAGLDPTTLAPSCGDARLCADTTCSTAFDGSDRFVRLQAALGGARMQLGSVCDPSFKDSLTRFAESLAPSTLPLQGTPADWRMLVVSVTRPDGGVVACQVTAEGTAGQAGADAVYAAPRFGGPAQLTFQGRCALRLGDRIDVRVICAG